MPCTLTALSVKIVASAETAMKAAIAREAIYEWNAAHAWDEKTALLPLFLEPEPEAAVPGTDILVAFFCSTQRMPEAVLCAGTEMAEHARTGRPLLIYISEARAVLNQNGAAETENFRDAFPAEAVIDSFKDEKEFRAKFAQKIDALVRYHPHFQIKGELSAITTDCEVAPAAVSFSESAQKLLLDACDDPEAYLARMNDSRGLKIQVNGRQYIKTGDAASAAEWDGAFNELLRAGLIRDAGFNGQLFQISSKGFEYLATLGKHPIGYIEELGSV